MAAFGFIYQGHDFGWKQVDIQSLAWPTQSSSPQQIIKDSDDAEAVYILYKFLLGHSMALSMAMTEFRQAMPYAFGPTLSWILPCDITHPILNTPPYSRILHP
jgi:hypothetical protein